MQEMEAAAKGQPSSPGALKPPGQAEKQNSVVSTKKTKFKKVQLPIRDEWVSLCELCYQCYAANEKCDYCLQVYFTTADDGEVDGKTWVACNSCDKWNHPDCEIEYGTDPVYREAAMEIKRQEELEAARELESYGQNQDNTGKDTAMHEQPPARETKMIITTESPDKNRDSEPEEVVYYCLACRGSPKQKANCTKKGQAAKKNASKAKAAASKKSAASKTT